MNKLKSIAILITLILISTNLIANAEGRNSVRIKYANQNVTDIVYNDEDKDKPYVMIYFDDGYQIKENKFLFKRGSFYVDKKELPKEKPPEAINVNGEKLLPIRTKYANQNVTDFVLNNKDINNPYVTVYFDDGSKIKEDKIKLKNGTCYVDTKKMSKEKAPTSIIENGKTYTPIRVKYANKNVTDFEYNDKDKNDPYMWVHFDNGGKELEGNILIKNNIFYVEFEN